MQGRRHPLQRRRLAGRAARAVRRRGARRSPRGTTSARSTAWSTRRSPQAGLALGDVGAVAVTQRPGLIGALLIGVATAKAIAYAARKPLVMVDHLHGHIAACWLEPVGARPAVRQPRRLRRPHPPGPGDRPARAARSWARRSTTPRGRPSTRAPACWASATPAGRPWSGWRRPDRAPPTSSPSGCAAPGTRDFSYAGVKTALLYAVRERRRAARRAGARRPGRLVPGGRAAAAGRPADRGGRRRGRAGRRARRRGGGQRAPARAGGGGRRRATACASRSPTGRLCTDNAAMIGAAAQFTEAVPWPRLPGPGRRRHGAARGDRGVRPVRRAAVALAGAAALAAPAVVGAQGTDARRPGAGRGPADPVAARDAGARRRRWPGATSWAPAARPPCRRRATRAP